MLSGIINAVFVLFLQEMLTMIRSMIYNNKLINISEANRMSKKNRFHILEISKHYLLPYTVAFFVLQFIVFYAFKASDKSFIWNIDGINQHYPVLSYYGQFLRDLVAGKGVRLLDYNVGMGFDTLTTLNYYAIGDTVSLLTIFGTPDTMEGLYQFLILFRIYLAGVSFILYCRYMGKKGFPSVLGALIYAFCGYVLFAGTRHPYFTNPMIYLPLLLIGLEEILRKKKPYLFVIMVFLSGICNFYFFYMLTILIFMYAVIRYFYTYKCTDKGVCMDFLKTALRAGLYYLLGVVMAAFLLLPVITAFLNNGRFDSGYDVNLWRYTKGYYVKMVNGFLAPNVYSGYWTHLAYAGVVPIGIMVLFRRKKYGELRIAFIITTLFLMIPFAGYLFNGFAYVSNRWEFGYSFLVAFIFVDAYDEMFSLDKWDKLLLVGGTGVYFILGLFRPSKYIWISLVLLGITILIVWYLNYNKKSIYLQKILVFTIVFINLGVNGYLTYHSDYGDYVSEFIDKGKVQATIENSPVSMIPNISEDSFYRVESYGDKQHNEALTVGFHEVAGYYSIMDKRVSEYMKGLELLNQRTAYRFDDMDYRATLGTLANVKYLVTSNAGVAPYGYKLISEEQNGDKVYYLFENQNVLPLGYTYDNYITRSDYENLSVLEKQEIMLHAIVVEDEEGLGSGRYDSATSTINMNSVTRIDEDVMNNAITADASVENITTTTADVENNTITTNNVVMNNSITTNEAIKNNTITTSNTTTGIIDTEANIQQLSTAMELDEGIKLDGNKLKVSKKGAKIRVNFQGIENAETYLRLENFNINSTKYFNIDLKVKGENGVKKTVNVRARKHNTYFGKENYLINLGYNQEPMSYIDITFNNKGTFYLGELQVFSLSMNGYDEKVKNLKENTLQDIVIENNKLTGNVTLEEDKLLCLSIPYSKGWTAYVNGKKEDVLQGNVMYLALPLQTGENEIVLKYTTPYLYVGIISSGLGWVVFLGIILWNRLVDKRGKVKDVVIVKDMEV